MDMKKEWFEQPEYKNGVVMKVTQKRDIPLGCDVCKIPKPTQKFIGTLGDEIYICGKCMDNIRKPLSTELPSEVNDSGNVLSNEEFEERMFPTTNEQVKTNETNKKYHG